MRRTFKHLSHKERVVIETLLREKKRVSYIARLLGRERSTIGREVGQWVVNPEDKYKADLAHFCAEQSHITKRARDKIENNFRLRFFVYRGLLSDFSPEQIAGSIKDEYPNDPVMSVSYETIYKHIYKHRQSRLGRKLIALLPYHHSSRRNKKRGRGFTKQSRIPEAISIDMRPSEVQLRQSIGHWEGDLMIGVGQQSAIGTLVERKTRYAIVVKIENRKSATVTQAFADEFKRLDRSLLKSMTYDNGMEMSNHKWLTQQTGLDIYFAHPYSSWERGTNENTNGLIRRYFPKGTDFNSITEQQLKYVQDRLNNRPRKVLNYKSPKFMMELEIGRQKHIKLVT